MIEFNDEWSVNAKQNKLDFLNSELDFLDSESSPIHKEEI